MNLANLTKYTYREEGGCKSYMNELSTIVYVKFDDVKKLLKQADNKRIKRGSKRPHAKRTS